MQDLSLSEALFCDFVWIFAMSFFYCKSVNTKKRINKSQNYWGLWFFITLYATFEFTGGDFYNYESIYRQIVQTRQYVHMEDFYCWLVLNLPEEYFIWRFCVWGLASLFWVLTLKIQKQDSYFAGLLFVLVVFYLFVGARQALCFSVQYFALTLILNRKTNKFSTLIIPIILLVISLSLHKTAIVYILIIAFSFLPLGKRSLIISILLFPVIYKIFDQLAVGFIHSYSDVNGGNADAMERYMNDENLESNMNGMIRLVIDRTPIILLLLYSLFLLYFKKVVEVPKLWMVLLNASYILIYVSFLFTGRDVSKFIAPRFWDASFFPLTLFLGMFFFKNRKQRFFIICGMLLIVSKFFTMAYTIYKL